MKQGSLFALGGNLALCALALAACSAPTPMPPTSTATPPSTATALPPTIAPQSTPVRPADVAVPASSVSLKGPSDVAFDSDGNLFVSQCHAPSGDQGPQVYKIDRFGLLTVYASPNQASFSGDGGPALAAGINCAAGLAFGRDGNLYLADAGNNRIRRIDRTGLITTVAGSDPGGFGGDEGPAVAALLLSPVDVAIDSAGNVYIADSGNNRIRKVDQRGTITTVAGTGVAGFSGDGGPATAATLNLSVDTSSPGIALDGAGQVYFADSGNGRVRKIDAQGIITTVAGDGGPVGSGDGGPAAAAALLRPTGLAFDAAGNLYISDDGSRFAFDNRVYKVDKQGLITTVVGSGAIDFSGDGGPALAATLNTPWGLAFDTQGNLYVVDSNNNRIRKVDQQGNITTVVGGQP